LPTLYGYYRSSAAYRVRIALALKGIAYDQIPVNLLPAVRGHKAPEYLALNPQGRVPFWVDDTISLSQSTAILEYLEESYPDQQSLLPTEVSDRAIVRQMVNLIACDIHPLNNLSVLGYLKKEFSADEQAVKKWYAHWISEGFSAFESLLKSREQLGFCFGDKPGMADIYLIPQVYNARRFGVPMDEHPLICQIDSNCNTLYGFQQALPENQIDASTDV